MNTPNWLLWRTVGIYGMLFDMVGLPSVYFGTSRKMLRPPIWWNLCDSVRTWCGAMQHLAHLPLRPILTFCPIEIQMDDSGHV